MTNFSFVETSSYKTVSFDIDGTLYPIRKVQLRWWKNFLFSPRSAIRFLAIRKSWERRRLGERLEINEADVVFFERFLSGMLDERLVSSSVRNWILELNKEGKKIFFLSDHGAAEKIRRLGLSGLGTAINCLTETGELKPHEKISDLLKTKYLIDPATHLHLGDRWTDEEQARLFGCAFRYFKP